MAVSLWQVIVNLRLTHPLCTCRPYIAAGSSYTLTHTHTHTHTHTYTLTNLYTVLLIFQSASLSWSLLRITSVGTRSHIGESFLSLSLSLSLNAIDFNVAGLLNLRIRIRIKVPGLELEAGYLDFCRHRALDSSGTRTSAPDFKLRSKRWKHLIDDHNWEVTAEWSRHIVTFLSGHDFSNLESITGNLINGIGEKWMGKWLTTKR